MIEIKVNVHCPELADLLGYLAKTGKPSLKDLEIAAGNKPIAPPTTAALPTVRTSGQDAQLVAVDPAAALAPVAPVEQPKTEAPSFTLAQIARAGADLMTAKPALQEELIALLKKYGAATVAELKQENFGAFAAELRKMGAKI